MALLVTILRAAVAHCDLPFLSQYQDRLFTIPSHPIKKQDLNNETQVQIDQATDEDYEAAVEAFAQTSMSFQNNLKEDNQYLSEVLIKKLKEMCPELQVSDEYDLSSVEIPVGNIRVGHVQPMAIGKHILCQNISISEVEPQLRRSSVSLRSIYEFFL